MTEQSAEEEWVIYVDGEPWPASRFKILSYENLKAMNVSEMFIPDYMRGGIIRYLECGIIPGSFLEMFLRNKLKETFGQADGTNLHHIKQYVMWFWNHAPIQCWGDEKAPENWQKFLVEYADQ